MNTARAFLVVVAACLTALGYIAVCALILHAQNIRDHLNGWHQR